MHHENGKENSAHDMKSYKYASTENHQGLSYSVIMLHKKYRISLI